MTAYDELIEEWSKNRPDYNRFCQDGILLDSEWKMARPKILFLLKESNGDFVQIRGACHGPYGKSRLFWRNLAIWRHVITECFKGRLPEFGEALAVKEVPLSDIAYVNLKKSCENRSASCFRDIMAYVERDWSYLEKQMEIINPDVVVCCGTMVFIRHLIAAERVSNNVFLSHGRIMIDFIHPSARKPYRTNFSDLVRILQTVPFDTPK